MATSTNKSGSDVPATFSYAQAAKGLVASTSGQATPEKQASSSLSSEQSRIDPAKGSESSEVGKQISESTPDAQSSSLTSDTTEKSDDLPEQELADSSRLGSGASTPATVTTATLPKDEDLSMTTNGSSDVNWDKQSQVSSSVGKSSQKGEGTKDKPAKKGSEKKEFKAAPIPAVNIWQQRKEAQEAKTKITATQQPLVTPQKDSISKPITPDARLDGSKSGNKKKADASGENSSAQPRDKKKTGDGSAASRRTGVRSHRSMATDSETADIPPVGDTASWPTPQLAQGEESRKSHEKPGKVERMDREKAASSRGHGKEKWTPVPYVPTAVFSTPLPPTARRSGRPPRNAREGGPQGGSHSATAGAGVPSRGSKDRGDAHPAGDAPKPRSNGAPATDDKHPRPAHSDGDAKTKSASEEASRTYNDGNHHSHPNTAEHSPRHRQDVKSFGKPHDFANFAPNQASSRHVSLPTDAQGNIRYGQNNERRFENGPRSADPYKETSNLPLRDLQQDRRESRSERGRGGYRGRGGPSNYASGQNPPYHSAPIGQHPFPSKGYNFNGERSRAQHAGHQNGSQQHASATRLGIRSPSMPAPSMYGPTPYPIQTELNAAYGYAHLPQGPMTAVPYQPYLEQYSLMSMISMQLEYYFSVDNLCKDLFLRKHMDSQGFVLLSVIASFKRIKSLTEDMELMRLVCRQLKNVEFRAGEDGLDRLRKREKWEQWVLKMDMRDASAQNEGPPALATSPSSNVPENPVNMAPQEGYTHLTNGTSHNASLADKTNIDTAARSAKLSSTAPEFSPLVSYSNQNDMNGSNNAVDGRSFPDNQIENLVIVVRKPGLSSPAHSPFLGPTLRFNINGFVDRYKAAGGPVNTDSRSLPVNRGFSLSSDCSDLERPEQREAKTRDSSSKLPESTSGHTAAFWVKGKDSSYAPLPTDLVHESYSVFREQTLEKRTSGASGDAHLDMDVLYQFWSHFLARNFNPKMYNEFRSLAFDDISASNSDAGFKHLLRFYNAVLSSNKVIADDQVARDVVDLVKSEAGASERPAFQRLRSAWRNGALNLKTRKKLGQVLDDDLRAELDK